MFDRNNTNRNPLNVHCERLIRLHANGRWWLCKDWPVGVINELSLYLGRWSWCTPASCCHITIDDYDKIHCMWLWNGVIVAEFGIFVCFLFVWLGTLNRVSVINGIFKTKLTFVYTWYSNICKYYNDLNKQNISKDSHYSRNVTEIIP